jgi:hypothetical protein
MEALTITQTLERRAIELNEAQIGAIVREYLARIWAVPSDEIRGSLRADYTPITSERRWVLGGSFTHEIVRSE